MWRTLEVKDVKRCKNVSSVNWLFFISGIDFTGENGLCIQTIYISIKDNGGLIYPSEVILKILTICEKYFRTYVSGNDFLSINPTKHLRQKLTSLLSANFPLHDPDIFYFKIFSNMTSIHIIHAKTYTLHKS